MVIDKHPDLPQERGQAVSVYLYWVRLQDRELKRRVASFYQSLNQIDWAMVDHLGE